MMKLKCYYTSSCLMGLTPSGWMAFASESDYFEYMECKEVKNA